MKSFLPIFLRTLLTFAVACGLQYFIPWYLLAIGGVVAGFFMLKTSDDRPAALGLLIGSIAFAIFAYLMAQIFPVTG
jgi:hypothetical protein